MNNITINVILLAVMGVAGLAAAVILVRLGYKRVLCKAAYGLVCQAEETFIGTKLGEARKAVVYKWLRARVPAAIRWLITDNFLDPIVEAAFELMKAALSKGAEKI